MLFCTSLFPQLSVCFLSCLSFCFSLICLAGCKDCLVLPYKVDHPRRRVLNFQERRTQVVLTSYCFFFCFSWYFFFNPIWFSFCSPVSLFLFLFSKPIFLLSSFCLHSVFILSLFCLEGRFSKKIREQHSFSFLSSI